MSNEDSKRCPLQYSTAISTVITNTIITITATCTTAASTITISATNIADQIIPSIRTSITAVSLITISADTFPIITVTANMSRWKYCSEALFNCNSIVFVNFRTYFHLKICNY
jgi:hypothetical protein